MAYNLESEKLWKKYLMRCGHLLNLIHYMSAESCGLSHCLASIKQVRWVSLIADRGFKLRSFR